MKPNDVLIGAHTMYGKINAFNVVQKFPMKIHAIYKHTHSEYKLCICRHRKSVFICVAFKNIFGGDFFFFCARDFDFGFSSLVNHRLHRNVSNNMSYLFISHRFSVFCVLWIFSSHPNIEQEYAMAG